MNSLRLTWNTLPPGNAGIHEHKANDWLGSEGRVTPPPLGIECFGVIDAARDDESANDWVPL